MPELTSRVQPSARNVEWPYRTPKHRRDNARVHFATPYSPGRKASLSWHWPDLRSTTPRYGSSPTTGHIKMRLMSENSRQIQRNFAPYWGKDEEDRRLFKKLNLDSIPQHVAIIMDGNGRWAQQRHLPRVVGHRAGIAPVRETVETAARLKLKILTLYAFSIENWKRPRSEVATLMSLLKEYLNKEIANLMANDIRFETLGRTQELDPSIQRELQWAREKTSRNRGLRFNVALNYGGRAELVDAFNTLWQQRKNESQVETLIDEQAIAQCLYTAGQPDPDLLIRTSGELRISNFLLWQIAYSEIWVTKKLWPDFRRRDFFEAVLSYQSRERRYGGLANQ